jgi:H+/Cl- antiporter ClcA
MLDHRKIASLRKDDTYERIFLTHITILTCIAILIILAFIVILAHTSIDILMSTHASILVDSVGPPSAKICRTTASFP